MTYMFHSDFSTAFAAFHPRQRPHSPLDRLNCHQANFVPFGGSLRMAAAKLLAPASRRLADWQPASLGRAADSDDLKKVYNTVRKMEQRRDLKG